MKNIILSIPDDLYKKSRDYAEKHGISLNEFIRTLLKQAVNTAGDDPVQKLIENSRHVAVNTKDWKWNRDEIYDREILS